MQGKRLRVQLNFLFTENLNHALHCIASICNNFVLLTATNLLCLSRCHIIMIEPLHNERDLLIQVAEGDRNAFTQLYAHYLSALYTYLYPFYGEHEETEEMIQDLFVHLWIKREKLALVMAFRPYLFRMARNRFLNQLRTKRVQKGINQKLALTQPQEANDVDHKLLFGQYYEIALQAIEQLPEKRQQVFKMRMDEGLSLDEIAEYLNISKPVVKKQLYAAVTFVRDYISRHAAFTPLLPLFISLFK